MTIIHKYDPLRKQRLAARLPPMSVRLVGGDRKLKKVGCFWATQVLQPLDAA
jgi:hypothetical protein